MQGEDADAVKQHSYRMQADNRVGETMAQVAHDGHGAQSVAVTLVFFPIRRDDR